jgi:FMN phosphatase YigB (HAD superfamily)
LLFDYGGTLVEEVSFNTRAGIDWLLAQAINEPSPDDVERILKRADRVATEVANRRDEFHIETPWPALTRLIHDACGTRFARPLADLELGFWDAAVKTRPMPGSLEALAEFRQLGIPMGVVSNSSFGQATIRHELAKHGLADSLSLIVVSAEYVVRKPNPLGLEAAARLLNVSCAEIWFVGDRLDTDVAGAAAAGMTPIWFSPSRQGGATDVISVGGWDALASMVLRAVD